MIWKILLTIIVLSTLIPQPSAQVPPTNIITAVTRAVMVDSNGVLKNPTNFFDTNSALVARGAGTAILSATNVWSGTNNFTNALQFKGTNVMTVVDSRGQTNSGASSFSSTNNSVGGVINFQFNVTNPVATARGRIVWNGILGLFTSPDDNAFNFFANTAHGGHGNGVEWQLPFNQLYTGPSSGGHFQFGLSTDGGDTLFFQRQNGDSFASNPNSWSAVLGFHLAYWPNSGTEIFEKWNQHATNINATTGESLLRFLPNLNDNGSEDGTFTGYFPAFDISSSGYGNMPNGIHTSVTNTTPGTNFTINFYTTESQQISIGQATSFSLTNIALTNRQQEIDLFVYPGPFAWPVSWINNATNILWENEAGNATAPSVVPASNVLHIHFTAQYGTMTNIIAHAMLSKYPAAIDPDAAAFISITGATNNVTNNAINTFVLAMKADGSWTNLQAIYPFLGYSAAADAWNLRNTNIDEIVWHGSVTHNLAGITGDGSTGFGDTQFNASTVTNSCYQQNSATIGVYSGTASATSLSGWMGAVDAGNHRMALYVASGAGFWEGEGPNSAANGPLLAPVGGSFKGHMELTQTSSTAEAMYSGSTSQVGSNATTGNPNASMYVLAVDNSGASLFSGSTISMAIIGGGMSSGQIANLQADILAFETALGRQ